MTLDPTSATLGNLVFKDGGQEPRRRPSFLVGAGGKVCPEELDGRQAQLVEQEGDRLKVDLYVIVEYGLNVAEVAGNVRSQVSYNVQRTTGRQISDLHIHVQGVRVGKQ